MKLKELLDIINEESVVVYDNANENVLTRNDFGGLIDPHDHLDEYKQYYDCEVVNIGIDVYGLIKYISIKIII